MEQDLKEYLEYLKLKNYTVATRKTRFGLIGRFIRWCEGINKQKAFDVTVDDLRDYRKYLEQKTCTPNTIDTTLRSLKSFFDYLEKQQILFWNPCIKLEFPTLGKRLPANILTEEEVKKLLSLPDLATKTGLRNRALMELLYSTAVRRSECEALNVFDLDLESGYVRVRKGKGQKERVIPLGKKACTYIKRYLKDVRSKWVEDIDSHAVFLTSLCSPLKGQAINVLIKKYGRALNLNKPVTTHSFRRAAVTHMLRNGASPLYLQRMLGHSTNAVMNKYIWVSAHDVKNMHRKKHPRERRKAC